MEKLDTFYSHNFLKDPIHPKLFIILKAISLAELTFNKAVTIAKIFICMVTDK